MRLVSKDFSDSYLRYTISKVSSLRTTTCTKRHHPATNSNNPPPPEPFSEPQSTPPPNHTKTPQNAPSPAPHPLPLAAPHTPRQHAPHAPLPNLAIQLHRRNHHPTRTLPAMRSLRGPRLRRPLNHYRRPPPRHRAIHPPIPLERLPLLRHGRRAPEPRLHGSGVSSQPGFSGGSLQHRAGAREREKVSLCGGPGVSRGVKRRECIEFRAARGADGGGGEAGMGGEDD